MISTAEIRDLQSATSKTRSVDLRFHVDNKKNFFVVKRVIDIVISLFVTLFILSWLFPLLAVLIKFESRGSILFIQRRVGLGGKTFRCLKFRTMFVNTQANSKQAQADDIRITRIGRFLRVSNLDEFPQFLNVLAGDMSIVGPRPHMHADCAKFGDVVPAYKFRNMVKPGITGLAQVKGYRGPTRTFASIFHRYQFDAFYVRNANFWLDMRIIRKTAEQTFVALVQKIIGKTQQSESRANPFLQRRWVMAIRSLLS